MAISKAALRCKKKFLRFFPGGYSDETYYDWERGYKWEAHEQWEEVLNQTEFRRLLDSKKFEEIAARAVRLESRTNLLFSFEKTAIRDAIKTGRRRRLAAAQTDASPDVAGRHGLRIHRRARSPHLPQAQRHAHRRARIRIRFRVSIEANGDTYASLLEFAEKVRRDTRDLRPKDMIDLQPFLWVQGSEECEE